MESTTGISAIYGPFLCSQRFGATPRVRGNVLSYVLREILSDLPSLGNIGRRAGAVIVRAFAGDRKVEMYNIFYTPGTYMPRTGFVARRMTRTYISIFLVFG